jgi:hypothetical protein
MATIRGLKKDVNYLTNDLIDECLVFLTFHPQVKDQDIDDIMTNILEKRNEVISKINHYPVNGDPKEVRKYFQGIYDMIEKDMIGALDELEKLEK